MDLEQREFRADPLKLKRLRVAAGLTVQEFAKQAGLDRTTVAKILRGDPVFLKSLVTAAQEVFAIDNPLELLHPEELSALGIQTELPSTGQVLEWDVVNYLSGWRETSNGLQYQLVQLKHRFLDGRLARGKCYELRHLPLAEQDRLTEHLGRHVEVCERIGAHPNIAANLTAAWTEGMWWVLDRWEDGETLGERLKAGPLGEYELRVIMTGIAQGLAALHESGIVRRELSPEGVLLRERDDRPILTDLELAKLTDGGPTVSPHEWPEDPYRALEVGGDTPVDERADFYSWGRIFVHASGGLLPERGREQVNRPDVPEDIQNLVTDCVSLSRSQRPQNIKTILTALKEWI